MSLFPRGFEIPIEAQIRAQKKLLKDSTVINYANLLAIRFEQLLYTENPKSTLDGLSVTWVSFLGDLKSP